MAMKKDGRDPAKRTALKKKQQDQQKGRDHYHAHDHGAGDKTIDAQLKQQKATGKYHAVKRRP
jgi:hypothetical protein